MPPWNYTIVISGDAEESFIPLYYLNKNGLYAVEQYVIPSKFVENSTACVRKLPSLLSRNLLDWLCFAELLLQNMSE